MYATADDIRKAYGQELLDIITSGQGVDAIDPAVALEQATSLINSYLGARYKVSDIEALATVPAILKDMCVDIAVYKLASDPARRTEDMETRYRDHLAHLVRISRGDAVLTELEEEPAPSVGGAVSISGADRVLGRDKTTGF